MESQAQFALTQVTSSPEHLSQIRTLFQTYAEELGVDLCFQGFEEELATLPGRYAPPTGGLMIAHDTDSRPVGCAAFRPFAPGVCELKRFFVMPEARRLGLASRLLTAILESAKEAGYHEALLDTLETLQPAIAFYGKHGFQTRAAYYDNPLPEVVYMSRQL